MLSHSFISSLCLTTLGLGLSLLPLRQDSAELILKKSGGGGLGSNLPSQIGQKV